MFIYQLHKYGGEYEDAYNVIIGSYLREDRAAEEKLRAEKEERELRNQHEKCRYCVFKSDGSMNIEYLLNTYSAYCDKAKLVKDCVTFCDKEWINCENSYYHWDDSLFYIEKVEVEE